MTIKLDLTRELPRDKVMARNPTLIGVIMGVRFYECAIHGDEAPLIAVTDTQCGYTDYYDMPNTDEFISDYNLVGA